MGKLVKSPGLGPVVWGFESLQGHQLYYCSAWGFESLQAHQIMSKSMKQDFEKMLAIARAKRQGNYQRLIRAIESGMEDGRVVRKDGKVVSVFHRRPKGIQGWYSTRELKERVIENFDRMEGLTGERKCRINGKHNLQIRGKHLRRLLKAMPNVRQEGRYLIEK